MRRLYGNRARVTGLTARNSQPSFRMKFLAINTISIFVAGLTSLALSPKASACRADLRDLKTTHLAGYTLCSFADDFAKAQRSMEQASLRPASRAAELLGPRFINLRNWEAIGPTVNFNPWVIYQPAPITWQKWEDGLALVNERVQARAGLPGLQPLTWDWIVTLHRTAMKDLLGNAGEFRHEKEIGKMVSRAAALDVRKLSGLEMSYPLISGSGSIVRWHPTGCLDDKSTAQKADFDAGHFAAADWPDEPGSFFADAGGVIKQCGYIEYAPAAEIPAQVTAWLARVNFELSTASRPDGGIDPIEIAARAQRWLVSIHPFSDGNGRVTRFVMDLILQSYGLPAPLLEDMNDDIEATEGHWANELGAGLKRALASAQACAAKPGQPRCRIVPKVAPSPKS